MKTINWGIIGCGNVTEKKSGPAFNLVPGSHLIAVMRRNREMAQDYARRHNVPKWYDDADALIHDPEVNAVYVATPPSSHCEYALKVIAARKPVYVEKPMATRWNECTKMVDAAKTAGVPLFVAYYRPFLSYFIKVKELVQNGSIGRPIAVNIRLNVAPRIGDDDQANPPWRVFPAIAGGGYFYDLASHQLDFLGTVFGKAKNISGTALHKKRLYPAEDVVMARYEYENGIVATGSWNFVARNEEVCDFIEIMGTEGKLSFASFAFTPIELTTRSGSEELQIERPDPIQLPLIRAIVEELQGLRKSGADLDMAVHTSYMLDEIVGN